MIRKSISISKESESILKSIQDKFKELTGGEIPQTVIIDKMILKTGADITVVLPSEDKKKEAK
jgi:hypothetical protein